ncbi:Apolipoprotein C-I [Merluccius polli]|uniref:Apolipoprotein C-I n=1 Tax=Merluccius polli TaxID=89951 RepID=A0AA47N369_MERPO|nr:Apolipoprotein C-I [Merluccius polli]
MVMRCWLSSLKMKVYLAVAVLLLALAAQTEAQDPEPESKGQFEQFGDRITEFSSDLAKKASETFQGIQDSTFVTETRDWFAARIQQLKEPCGPLMAQTPSPPEEDSMGILGSLAQKAREAKDKVQATGTAVLGFAEMYYDEHIRPMTDFSWDWPLVKSKNMWWNIQKTFDEYRKPSNSSD